MKSDQSVPLSEALERFSDQSNWDELRSLKPYRILAMFLGEPESEYTRLHWRYRELKERLETAFLEKLTAGSLQASGFVWPKSLNAKRRLVPAVRWHELKPDFAASEATGGGGLRVVDIRIEAHQARTRSSHSTSTSERMPREHASLARLRTELRRWLQREAQSRGMSWQKKHYCSAARIRFGNRITNNLFNEVWRSADLPEALRQPGLRKIKDYLADSAPSA
jgi:hypothetical protein